MGRNKQGSGRLNAALKEPFTREKFSLARVEVGHRLQKFRRVSIEALRGRDLRSLLGGPGFPAEAVPSSCMGEWPPTGGRQG